MLETIREIEGKCFIFISSISGLPNMLKKLARKHTVPIMKLLVFIFHDGNRAHFTQVGKNLRR